MKKNRKISQGISKYFASIIVLAVFLLPLVLMAGWVQGIASGGGAADGSHKASVNEKFHIRPADTKSELTPFSEPIISVTFDDGWESVYSEAYPLMQKYGIHSTQYILADQFNSGPYMSLAQVRDLHENGHEIASHTIHHYVLTNLSDTDLHTEVAGSKALLSSKIQITDDFASPEGKSDKRTTEEIKKNYRSARNTTGDPRPVTEVDVNLPDNFDRYNINAYTVRQSTTLDDIKNMVEYAQRTNAWIVITYHQVDWSGAEYGVSPEAFESHMKYLFDAKIRSAPLGRVIDAIDKDYHGPTF